MILTTLTNEEIISTVELCKYSSEMEEELARRLLKTEETLLAAQVYVERNIVVQNKKYLKLMALVHISGHFLTDFFPEDFSKLNKVFILDFIENHKSENFDMESKENIWNQINELADSFVLLTEKLY